MFAHKRSVGTGSFGLMKSAVMTAMQTLRMAVRMRVKLRAAVMEFFGLISAQDAEGYEECDDANVTLGDGCSNACLSEECGNGRCGSWRALR